MHVPDDLLLHTLRRMSAEEIAALPDVSEGLEHRVKRYADVSATAEELCLEGPVEWTDRFDPAVSGKSAGGLAFDVPAHGTRLVYASGKAALRRWYGGECAQSENGVRLWPCVFAPTDGDYTLVFRADGESPYRVKVNGLDLGEFHGGSRVRVRLWRAENSVRIAGPGAGTIRGMELQAGNN